MNRRGFTLTEMLATIVILGIIIAVAIPAYITITNNMKENNYENKINYIESKAIEYANDNQLDPGTITVAKLISEGYLDKDSNISEDEIDPDNFFSQYTNPKGGYLDCYKVNITMENNEYHAEVVETLSDDEGACELAYQETLQDTVIVGVYDNTTNALLDNKWTSNDVKLKVSSNSDNILLDKGVTYVGGGVTKSKEGLEYVVNGYDQTLINTTFKVILYIQNGDEVGIVSKNVKVMMDRENPTLDYTVDRKWTSGDGEEKRPVTLYPSDGAGSGILGVYITDTFDESKIKDKNNYKPVASDGSYTTKLSDGDYYILAMDNVGNISKYNKIRVSNIDGDVPDCMIPTLNTATSEHVAGNVNSDYKWYGTSDIAGANAPHADILFKCNQEESRSGCAVQMLDGVVADGNGLVSFTNEARYNKKMKYKILTTAGGERTCDEPVQYYLDKTKPTCNSNVPSPNNFGWYKGSVSVSYGCKDDPKLADGSDGSGCDSVFSDKNMTYSTEGTHTYTIDKNTGSGKEWIIRDNAYNRNYDCSITFTTKIDTVSPICKNTSSYTTWTNSSREVKWYGEDTNTKGANEISGMDPSNNGGRTYVNHATTYTIDPYTIKDRAGNITNCDGGTINVLVDRAAPTSSIQIISTTSNYNSKDVSVVVRGHDIDSGVVKACITATKDSSKCNWVDTNYDVFQTSYTFDADDGSGKEFTLYGYTKDAAGNISSASSATYKLYTKCTNWIRIDGNSCSAKCNGGTKNRLGYDRWLKDTRCESFDVGNGGAECNTQDCCSDTWVYDTGAWGACSNACGAGTQYRTEYRKSKYDNRVCPTTSGSQSCTSSTSSTTTAWSACSKNCATGTQSRTTTVTGAGGTVCSTSTETQNCNASVVCSYAASSTAATSTKGSCKTRYKKGESGAQCTTKTGAYSTCSGSGTKSDPYKCCKGGCGCDDYVTYQQENCGWSETTCNCKTYNYTYSCSSGTLVGTNCYSCAAGYYLSGTTCYHN